ncbi:MmgE/PrpD family protein [Kyrpidia sp.]|uniref:MmgE/PrpD family protein n=1 Tax=Kyrpidia sp. TaxID=2073077 RepID=UPI00258BCBBF|nr:MmgE/PrpD family protein [Kyrpidia sp.]MCL6575709.1 MmgE/PrpD family protein [Kyrpidia sp.]
MAMQVTQEVAFHVQNTQFQQLSPLAIQQAKRSLLNWIGTAIGGAGHPAVEKVLRVAERMGGRRQVTILGRHAKSDPLFGALINGLSSHVHDFDDTLLQTVLHPSAPVFPAILAYAELRGARGEDILLSFVVGCEVEARLARCLYPSHYLRGWHITGTVGAIGAAAAVGKLMNLDKKRLAYAVGIAATTPTGLREMFGTMTKSLHPGKAAMNGLLAALLAEEGFTSSLESLEGKRGFGHVLSDDPHLELVNEGWGVQWEVEYNTFKPYASGVVTHPAIDAAIALRNRYNLTPEEIRHVRVEGHPLVDELTGKRHPESGLDGKFSVYHCVAVALIDGNCGLQQFTDERVADPLVCELRDKVSLSIDPGIREDEGTVTITRTNGEVVSYHVEHVTGSAANPMSDSQLEQKFLDLTGDVLVKEKQQRIIEGVRDFEHFENIRSFLEACVP